MNRYEVTFSDGKQIKLYYSSVSEVYKNWDDILSVREIKDNSHLIYIDKIKASSSDMVYDYRGREAYRIDKPMESIFVKLLSADGEYLDAIQYQRHIKAGLVVPCLWDMMSPEGFCNQFLKASPKWKVVSERQYGQPKLSKPKELKGIKPIGSVDFIPNKASCAIHVLGDDIYIKHRDYFSSSYCPPEMNGTPLNVRLEALGVKKKAEKFIYSDSWGDVVLRNEAWLCVKDFVQWIRQIEHEGDAIRSLQKLAGDYYNTDMSTQDWGRFLEGVVRVVREGRNV